MHYKKSSAHNVLLHIVIWCFVGLVILCTLFVVSLLISCSGEIYETNDINEYGNFVGNHDNRTPAEYIGSFFPETIDPDFSDVTYHYKAKKCDSYGFEIWLEFSFANRADFETYIANLTKKYDFVPFFYDDSYMEHSIDNLYEINLSAQGNKYLIQAARIGKILYSDSKNSIIYLAIGVCDGGGTNTDDVDYFFKRFEIDPALYQEASREGNAMGISD